MEAWKSFLLLKIYFAQDLNCIEKDVELEVENVYIYHEKLLPKNYAVFAVKHVVYMMYLHEMKAAFENFQLLIE